VLLVFGGCLELIASRCVIEVPVDRSGFRPVAARLAGSRICEVISWNSVHELARRLARKIADSGYRPEVIPVRAYFIV